jgi:high-affinity Fe2+/Pb2+ permease
MKWLRRYGGIVVGYMVSEGVRKSGYGWDVGILCGLLALIAFVLLVELWWYLDRLEKSSAANEKADTVDPRGPKGK